jgi:hypothetical protein
MASKITFYISEFNTDIEADKLGYVPTAITAITGDIQTTISVAVATVRSMFKFINAGGVSSGTALLNNSATKFKFDIPSPTITYSNSLVTDSSSYAVIGDTIGSTYMRYVANSLFGSPSMAQGFTDYATMDETINVTVNTTITNKLGDIAAANTAAGGYINATGDNNPTYKLCRQFGDQLNNRFTSTMLANTTDFQAVPLIASDEIVFQFKLIPDSTQYSVNGSNNTSLVSPVTGTIKIICTA